MLSVSHLITRYVQKSNPKEAHKEHKEAHKDHRVEQTESAKGAKTAKRAKGAKQEKESAAGANAGKGRVLPAFLQRKAKRKKPTRSKPSSSAGSRKKVKRRSKASKTKKSPRQVVRSAVQLDEFMDSFEDEEDMELEKVEKLWSKLGRAGASHKEENTEDRDASGSSQPHTDQTKCFTEADLQELAAQLMVRGAQEVAASEPAVNVQAQAAEEADDSAKDVQIPVDVAHEDSGERSTALH